ncbi:ubiquitin carboxyl-terminal hydrolase 36-like [Neocloeon triangulifer]|uniref:ubiquitin carboxyl-terminal hydrolase 36-like n=1 Tax=Neocloeon triangulifer TaxID=2078957 RepID=UPI00286F3230|nr:ubiquitin carboxyl-terminal hydrolase 36-like [Neocloeon triangulifer]
MPASVNESISASLQMSIWSSNSKLAALENGGGESLIQHRMASVAKMVPDIAYETSNDTYYSSVLQKLKAKYNASELSSAPAAVRNGGPEPNKDNVLALPTRTLFQMDKVQMVWQANKICKVGSGFSNAGNTCYLNSVLQALFHIPPLFNWLQFGDQEHQNSCATYRNCGQDCIVCCMALTLKNSQVRTGDSTRPVLILNKLRTICKRLQVGHQEDAMEFLRYLLESMEKSYLQRHNGLKLDNRSKETTPLNQIFGGYIRTEVTCMSCHAVSTTFQHFLDLTLDITRANTLDNALDNYFAQERLEDNSYRCEKCKKKVPATKQFFVERPPNVLCIQLKRFSIEGKKIGKKIMLNERIHLHKYKPRANNYHHNNSVYRLVAGVNHLGHSAHSGHYTTMAYAHNNNLYIFDDTCVQQQYQRNFSGTDVYVLMYILEPKKQLAGPSKPPTAALSSQPMNQHMFIPSSLSAPKPVKSFTPGTIPAPKPAIIFYQKEKIILPPNQASNKVVFNPNHPSKNLVNTYSYNNAEKTNGSTNKSEGLQNSISKSVSRLPSLPVLVPYQDDHSSDEHEDDNSRTTPTKSKPNPAPGPLCPEASLPKSAPRVVETKSSSSESNPSAVNGYHSLPQVEPPKDSQTRPNVKSTSSSWSVSSADKTPPSQTTIKVSTNPSWVVTEAQAAKALETQKEKPKENLKRKHDAIENEEMEWIEKPKDKLKVDTNASSDYVNTVSSTSAFNKSKQHDYYGPLLPGSISSVTPKHGLKGYGGADVRSWNGTKSNIDKQVSEDFWMRKRDEEKDNDYDEFDGGKRKKFKSYDQDRQHSHHEGNKFQRVADWRRKEDRDFNRHYDRSYDNDRRPFKKYNGDFDRNRSHGSHQSYRGNNSRPFNNHYHRGNNNRHDNRKFGHKWQRNHHFKR